MLNSNEVHVDNNGSNSGVLVGCNAGTINYILRETVKIPSLISSVVKILGSVCITEDDYGNGRDFTAFKPDEKIEYNCVIKYKEIIIENAAYYTYCDNTLNIYDDSNIGSKAKILRCVRNWYLESKGKLLLELKACNKSDIEKVRENADFLIEAVIQKMQETIFTSSNLANTHLEELSFGIICFVCYCFMKCKLLEKPI